MTKPCNRRCGDHLDEQLETVSVGRRRGFRNPQRSVRPMMPQGCRQVHHAEVVDRAIFATRNSLKSHMGRNLKSPFSKPRAITPKLYTHSRLAAGENHPASKSKLRAVLSSR